MGKAFSAVLVVCAMFLFSNMSPSHAAEPEQQTAQKPVDPMDDLHFSVGFKLWLSTWNTWDVKPEIISLIPLRIRTHITTTRDFSPSYIPNVGLRYKDIFVSASGRFTGTYEFDGFDGKAKEADFNVGYYIHPWIALTAGYKGIFQRFAGEEIELNYNGGTLGAVVNVPIPAGGLLPPGFSLYGNGGGGWMGVSIENFGVKANHATYGTVEGGLAFKPGQIPLVFTAGYKWQILNTKIENVGVGGKNAPDITRGVMLGVSFVH